MSQSKDWPSQLHEFYYNYNNCVNKSTKASHQLHTSCFSSELTLHPQ
jgi:hypothetical protein